MSIVLYPGVNWSMNCALLCWSTPACSHPKDLGENGHQCDEDLGTLTATFHACPGTSTVSWDRQLIIINPHPLIPAADPWFSIWSIYFGIPSPLELDPSGHIWGERSKEHQAKNEHGQRDLHNAKGIDVTIFSCPGWKLETTLIALEIAVSVASKALLQHQLFHCPCLFAFARTSAQSSGMPWATQHFKRYAWCSALHVIRCTVGDEVQHVTRAFVYTLVGFALFLLPVSLKRLVTQTRIVT